MSVGRGRESLLIFKVIEASKKFIKTAAEFNRKSFFSIILLKNSSEHLYLN